MSDIAFLQVDGWQERSGDWILANDLTAAGGFAVTQRLCQENFMDFAHIVGAEDFASPSMAAVYSLGCGDTWGIMCGSQAPKRAAPLEILFIVLGCVNWDDGQVGGEWHPQPWFTRCVCFQIDEAFPKSNAMQGNIIWVDILDPQAFQKIMAIVADEGCVNVSCKSLWTDGTDPLVLHTETQNRPEVRDLIVQLAQAVAEMIRNQNP